MPTEFYQKLHAALQAVSVAQHMALVDELNALRWRGGRLFCLGMGGGAANAAHAVNDFRKLCGIQAYAPTDGIAEITARANDDGLKTIFSNWLAVSGICENDAIMVFSVGGGTDMVSTCIAEAVVLALSVGARILGVVGRTDGFTAKLGHMVIVIGEQDQGSWLTPVTETVQIAVLHALVSDPRLCMNPTKW